MDTGEYNDRYASINYFPDEDDHNGAAFAHAVGDLIQILPDQPALTVVGRRCGHFGAVYIAKSAVSGSLSAFKSPRQDRYLSDEHRKAFTREAARWVSLPKNVLFVEAYRTITYGRRPYVHTEFIQPICNLGSSLEDLIESLPTNAFLSQNLILAFAGQLIQAVRTMRNADATLLHGDIKPSNILVRSTGPLSGETPVDLRNVSIALSDFGLSRSLSEVRVDDYSLVGDVRYMPPEMLILQRPDNRLKPVNLDADLYAIGCTVLEMITSRHWQESDGSNLRTAWRSDENKTIHWLSQMRRDLPHEMLSWAVKSVHIDPASRWASVDQMWSEWQRAVRASGGDFLEVSTSLPEPDRTAYPNVTELSTYRYYVSKGLTEAEAARVCDTTLHCSNLINAGQFKEGEAEADALLQSYPWLAPAISLKALAAILSGRRVTAIRRYMDALAAYGSDLQFANSDVEGYAANSATLAQLLAVAPEETGLAALHYGALAVRLAPGNGRCHLALGLAKARQQDYEGALDAFGQGLGCDAANRRIVVAHETMRVLLGLADSGSAVATSDLAADEVAEVNRGVALFRKFEAARTNLAPSGSDFLT